MKGYSMKTYFEWGVTHPRGRLIAEFAPWWGAFWKAGKRGREEYSFTFNEGYAPFNLTIKIGRRSLFVYVLLWRVRSCVRNRRLHVTPRPV